MKIVDVQKLTAWLKTKCEALSPKQHQMILWLLFIAYSLLTFWMIGDVAFASN